MLNGAVELNGDSCIALLKLLARLGPRTSFKAPLDFWLMLLAFLLSEGKNKEPYGNHSLQGEALLDFINAAI